MAPARVSRSDSDGVVDTVLGPVASSELGVTLTHEHVFVDITSYWSRSSDADGTAPDERPIEMSDLGRLRYDPFGSKDNCVLDDADTAIAELERFRRLGGGTIVDVTTSEIGRNVKALRAVARATGLNVVAACGHYVHIFHEPTFASESVDVVAQRLVRELSQGIEGTDIRAGIIGEIGTSPSVHRDEEKALRASARAHVVTGKAITLHLHPQARRGHEVLAILESEGADPECVVMGHLDNDLAQRGVPLHESIAYHESLGDRGCYLQYDTVGNDSFYPASDYSEAYWLPSDRERALAIAQLVEDGYERQILVSHDVCKKSQLARYGGLGYAHVLRRFVDQLRLVGLDDDTLRLILVENPGRMLAGTRRRLAHSVESRDARSVR